MIVETDMLQQFGMTEVPLSDIKVEITPEDLEKWDTIIADSIGTYNQEHPDVKDSLALMVGRFQPPHKGHAFEMYAGLKKVDPEKGKLVIVLGSPNKQPEKDSDEDKRHPFPFEERSKLLIYIAKQFGIKDVEKKIGFIHMRDVGNDELWGQQVTELVEGSFEQPIDVVIANDAGKPHAVEDIFRNRGKRILSVPFLEESPGVRYEGASIRKHISFAPGGKNRVKWPK